MKQMPYFIVAMRVCKMFSLISALCIGDILSFPLQLESLHVVNEAVEILEFKEK